MKIPVLFKEIMRLIDEDNRGFSLLFLVMLLFVGGVSIIGFATFSLKVAKEGKQSITHKRLLVIQKNLINYYRSHNDLPNPVGVSSGERRSGNIPISILGLDSKYSRDGWGQFFVYRINKVSNVIDVDALTVNTTSGMAAVVVSSGSDKNMQTAGITSNDSITIDPDDLGVGVQIGSFFSKDNDDELSVLAKYVWLYSCKNPVSLSDANPWSDIQANFALAGGLQKDSFGNNYNWFYDGIGRSQGEFYSFGPNGIDDGRISDDITVNRIEQECPIVHSSVPDPLGKWNFDSNGDLGDSVGTNHGIVSGDPTWTADGKFGGALQFDGDDAVIIESSQALNLTKNLTLSAWVKETGRNTNAKVISRRSGSYFYFIGVDNGHPYGGIGDSLNWEVTTRDFFEMPLNEWHHIAFSYDDDADKMYFYYDGVLRKEYATSISLPTMPGDIDLSIGGDNQGTNAFFTGTIDEASLYNVTLNLDQVRELYNIGSVAEMNYPFNGNLADISGNSNNGTTVGDPDQTATGRKGVVSQAIGLDGDDAVRVLNSSVKNTGEYSIMAWVKETSRTTQAKIVSRRYEGDTSAFCFIGSDGGNLYSGIGDGDPATYKVSDKSVQLSLNQWHHVAMTYNDSDNKMLVYLDGVKVYDENINLILPGQAVDLSIGSDMRGSSRFFTGSVDEVKVYSTTLSGSAIQTYYNATKP